MPYVLRLSDVNEYVSEVLPEDDGMIVETVPFAKDALMYPTAMRAIDAGRVIRQRLEKRGFMNAVITAHQHKEGDDLDAAPCETCQQQEQRLAELQAEVDKKTAELKTSRELNDEFRKLCAGKDADYQRLQMTVDMQVNALNGLRSDLAFWRGAFETGMRLVELYLSERGR
jgi:DNA-binding transcriptional MerR regulator